MGAANVKSGMTVADIGAGEGYYTIRLAAKVGAKGRVLAEDIVPLFHDRLADRVYRDQLDNVSVKLGKPVDPQLPPGSFDRIFMVHMYHEIEEPYEFLWNLRPALAPEGMVVVVDADRPTPVARHAAVFARLRIRPGRIQIGAASADAAGGRLSGLVQGRGPTPRSA